MERINLEYLGFKSECTWREEDNCYGGKIDNISDLVTYQSYDHEEIIQHFSEAVDDYVELCRSVEKEPKFIPSVFDIEERKIILLAWKKFERDKPWLKDMSNNEQIELFLNQ